MEDFLSEQEVDIGYSPVFREYYIGLTNGTSSIQLIYYCPWCAKRLPNGLRDEYCDIIRNEYGSDPWEYDDLPEEFRTDEWWKKRGL